MTTSKERFTYPSGVRYDEGQVREKIMSTRVIKQKYTPLRFLHWENEGNYAVVGCKTWWRETADGTRHRIRGQRRLQGLDLIFYPIAGTNAWLGIDTGPFSVLIPIIDDAVGKGVYMPLYAEYDVEDEVYLQFFGKRASIQMGEEKKIKLYDILLFDANRRLLFRNFEPGEQYYEYDALTEALAPVTLARARHIKSNYDDLFRIPISARHLYWERETLRPDFRYFRPYDPVRDAAPEWRKPETAPAN